jgi:hypothetical protein
VGFNPTIHNKISPTIQFDPISDTSCHVLVTRQGDLIHHWTYWTLIDCYYKWL